VLGCLCHWVLGRGKSRSRGEVVVVYSGKLSARQTRPGEVSSRRGNVWCQGVAVYVFNDL
jgi:hypothetical protein